MSFVWSSQPFEDEHRLRSDVETVDKIRLPLIMGQIEMSNVQQRWLTGQRIGFVGVNRHQRNLPKREIARLNQLVLRRSVGLIEGRGVWEVALASLSFALLA